MTDNQAKLGCLITVPLALLLCGSCLYCGGLFSDEPYSTGYRDGNVQKFSRKGWLNKSHEGELALAGFKLRGGKNSASDGGNVWQFSVEDGESDVLKELEAVHGDEVVRLHYQQWIFFNPTRHATGYRVYKVERLKGGER